MDKYREWALSLKVGDIVCLIQFDHVEETPEYDLKPGLYKVAQHWWKTDTVVHSNNEIYVALAKLNESNTHRAVNYTKLIPGDSKAAKVLYGRN